MSRQKFIIEMKRTEDGFTALADGKELDIDQIATLVDIMKDELEASLTIRNDVIQRRAYIAANDLFKGKTGYLGSSKLAKHFNVSGGTISVDRKVIIAKNIQPDPEVIKKLEELNAPPEPVTEELATDPAPETTPEAEKLGKKNGKGKGKKGKK